MCGLPGGLDYAMLVGVKEGWLDRLTEKRVNRMMNLTLRMPPMQLVSYIIIMTMYNGEHISVWEHPVACCMMLCGAFLHTFNAIYYCDKVVSNYALCVAQAKQAKTNGGSDDMKKAQ